MFPFNKCYFAKWQPLNHLITVDVLCQEDFSNPMHIPSDRGQSQQTKGSFFTTSSLFVHLTLPLVFYVMRWRKLYWVELFWGRMLYVLLRNALIGWLKVTRMFLPHKSDWKIHCKWWKIWSRKEDIQQRDSPKESGETESSCFLLASHQCQHT